MKRLLLLLLLVMNGCQQQNQKQEEYRLEKTEYGYVIFLARENYTFMNDMELVLQDERFITHIVFWSTICGYFFFALPFTDYPPIEYIIVP